MKINEINDYYEKACIGVFPFVGGHRVTVLQKGLYKKLKSNYRGVTYKNNKVMLFGYYWVPDDFIVVPNNIDITEGKERLINYYENKGFKKIDKAPSLKTVEFEEDSFIYKSVLNQYKLENNGKNKTNNKSTQRL